MDEFADPEPYTRPLSFSALLDKFDQVEESADGYVVPCPSHNDSNPSLRIAYSPAGGKVVLKCRAGCATTDVVESLGLKMSQLFNVPAGDMTNIRASVATTAKVGASDRAALALYLRRTREGDLGPAQEYAARRFGIDPDKFSDLGLGYDDGTISGGNLKLSRAKYHDSPRLVVPFRGFDGHPHYLQARALGPAAAKWSGPTNPEGASWGTYGLIQGGTGWSEVIICEGPSDGLTVASVGYDTVIVRGASLGANAALADEVAAGLAGRRVIVAGDNDTAGRTFTRTVCAALSERDIDVRRLTIPDSAGNDVTDWRESAGSVFSKTFIDAVSHAPKYGSDQIIAEEISQDITRLFSDVYNAHTLLQVIRDQGSDVRFSTEVGFIIYRAEKGTWQLDEAEWTRSQAQQVAERVQRAILAQMQGMDSRIMEITDQDAREGVGKTLDTFRKKARSGSLVNYVMSTRGIDSMIRELRALPGVFASYEEFDQHPHLLAATNGVINLETGHLLPYDERTKDLYLMRSVGVAYDPDAECPRWEQFLREVFDHHPENDDGPHSGLPEFMQRLIGYGITGHTVEQALAVFYGGGSNGKGVLNETLSGIFKGVTVTTPFSTFEAKPAGGIPNDIAALKGSRLVMASEGEAGKHMAESLIKRLTGGDTISARFMRREYFEFVPTFLIILATNYKPNFKGNDYGLWRRVKMVPFTRRFTAKDRDPHLTNKFLGKRVPAASYHAGDDFGDGPAGILTWAVRGAVLWHKEGLMEPRVVVESTAEFKETSDALSEFYAEHITKDEEGKITGKAVWDLYSEWCEEENLPRNERWRRQTFWKALEERGAVRRSSGGKVYFRGIRLRRPSEHHPDVDGAPDFL